jgi:hypothetical protein
MDQDPDCVGCSSFWFPRKTEATNRTFKESVLHAKI